MTKEYTETLTEVSEILKHMSSNDINKIPKKVMDFINDNKNNDYRFSLDKNLPFSEQSVKRETLIFLSLLSLNYWCKNEEEKNKLYNSFKLNEENYEIEMRKKYNPDNLFQEKQQKTNIKDREHTELIEYKEPNLFMKILNKIKNILLKIRSE